MRKSILAGFILAVIGLAAVARRFDAGPRMMLSAALHGDRSKVILIHRLGISANSDIWLVGGLLHCAAAQDNPQAMELLVAAGADIHRRDGYRATPQEVASKLQRKRALNWLAKNGVAVRTNCSMKGKGMAFTKARRHRE